MPYDKPLVCSLESRAMSLLTEGRAARLGVVTAEASPILGPDGRPLEATTYVWRPPPAVMPQLPAGFTFAMRGVVGPDGLRTFYPGSFQGQIATGFAGGLALLASLFGLSPEQRYSYRAMYQLFL